MEQLKEQPPAKKPRIDKPEEEEEIAKFDEAGLPKSAEMIEHKESGSSTTIVDLPTLRPLPLKVLGIHDSTGIKPELETSTTTTVDLPRGHRKLPPELEQQIFLCLNPAAQRKFIWGLNWNFYAMFRYRLLTKSKRVRNPHGNLWNNTNTRATVAADGLSVSNEVGCPNVFAEKPFTISGPHCRMDEFPGTILYYYEVKVADDLWCNLGISSAIADNLWIGGCSNSYSIDICRRYCYEYCFAGEDHLFELPDGAIRPEMKQLGNVYGCGLVLDPDNKLAIFFTLNGHLLGRKIPISPTVDRLFPAVTFWNGSSFVANFGDDPAKPFEYDIQNCPGLELVCI